MHTPIQCMPYKDIEKRRHNKKQYEKNRDKYLEYAKQYRELHREEINRKSRERSRRPEVKARARKHVREYWRKNKERLTLQHKEWLSKNLQYVKQYQADYEKTPKRKTQRHGYYIKTRPQKAKEERQKRVVVIKHYSNNKINCKCCNQKGIKFLTIDHIEGRKAMNHKRRLSSTRLIDWLIKNNYPKGFQVLCWNCNCAKGFYEKCSHEVEKNG